MAEDEHILARWSRLKRERAAEKAEQKSAGEASDPTSSQSSSEATDNRPPVPVDGSKLPPIESIVAGTDIRAFLEKGVPVALSRAALRRAWSSDPAIRDFIEMAENQWDFARPESIPGFGSLGAGDKVADLVAKALGEWSDRTELGVQSSVADAPAGSARPTDTQEASSAPCGQDANSSEPNSPTGEDGATATRAESAPQHARCDAREGALLSPRARRGHGGALPS